MLQITRPSCSGNSRPQLQAMDGVAQVLANLDAPCCVTSSSNRERVLCSLALTGLDGFFKGNVFALEDVKKTKPAPDIFLLAAQKMGAKVGPLPGH